MASNLLAMASDGLQPNSDGLHPKSDGLQPESDGLHQTTIINYTRRLQTRFWHASQVVCRAGIWQPVVHSVLESTERFKILIGWICCIIPGHVGKQEEGLRDPIANNRGSRGQDHSVTNVIARIQCGQRHLTY